MLPLTKIEKKHKPNKNSFTYAKNDSVLNLLMMKTIVMFAITVITQETIEVVHIVSVI